MAKSQWETKAKKAWGREPHGFTVTASLRCWPAQGSHGDPLTNARGSYQREGTHRLRWDRALHKIVDLS